MATIRIDLSSLDGSNGFRLVAAKGFNSSSSVSNAGDVNGDGFDDVIIGNYSSGSSYVVFGKAAGFDASMDLSSLNGSDGFRLRGDQTGFSVSNAGDVNGDGFDDVIIGAPGYSVTNSGSSYVVFGKAAGFDATVDLSSLDNSTGFRLDAERGGAGSSVSGAGDVNGDGFDDLIVDAPLIQVRDGYSFSYLGYSYVIFGRDFSSNDAINGTPGDDVLRGTVEADTFNAGNGNDLMFGKGGADVFHGDAGNDHIKVTDLSFGSVDGGIGSDVLHLAGSNLNLDLASASDKISGIESICIYGRGDNTLTLTAADLLNLSDTTNTLKVHGNAGDHIVGLSSGWTDGGMRPNGYFHTYTQGDAVLLVGLNLTTDFV